jgi:hypothetical protein
MRKFTLLVTLLLCANLGAAPARALFQSPAAPGPVFLPLVIITAANTPQDSLIADHRHTDIQAIPDYWIEQARPLVIHYAHTSHGSQVLSGLEWLESQDPRYNVDIQASGSVVLPPDTAALRIYDGNNYPGDTYITPEMYWETADGLSHTRSTLNTGWFDISLWTWCGQMSYYSDAQVQSYIDTLGALEAEYPGVRFIYYTGHTDGSQPGSPLWTHNEMLRQHIQQSGGALFDFADIESYDPAGVFYPAASDACEWCDDWCAQHPGAFECQSLPSCAHTHGLQCTLKAQAFWWLLARLTGWDGEE